MPTFCKVSFTNDEFDLLPILFAIARNEALLKECMNSDRWPSWAKLKARATLSFLEVAIPAVIKYPGILKKDIVDAFPEDIREDVREAMRDLIAKNSYLEVKKSGRNDTLTFVGDPAMPVIKTKLYHQPIPRGWAP
jgi:hypothetical protein